LAEDGWIVVSMAGSLWSFLDGKGGKMCIVYIFFEGHLRTAPTADHDRDRLFFLSLYAFPPKGALGYEARAIGYR